MHRCTHCTLPDTFPGIHLNEKGVCQFCQHTPDPNKRDAQKAKIRGRFESVVEEVRQRPGYHCLVAWSGGKDSTYTVRLLKEQYNLNILSFTFDNSFISPTAFKNIRTVSEYLGVDHICVKPSFTIMRQLFTASLQPGMYSPKALEQASGICNTCMAIAKGVGLRLALERHIPLLVYGWSPGQPPLASAFFELNASMLKATLNALMAPLTKVAGDAVRNYFPEPEHLEEEIDSLYNVSPLAFLPYNEESTIQELQAIGWQRPKDTDPNSNSCLLNSFANLVHFAQMGYHPYALELSELVREGYLSQEEATERLEAEPSPEVVAAVQAKLGISPFMREVWENAQVIIHKARQQPFPTDGAR